MQHFDNSYNWDDHSYLLIFIMKNQKIHFRYYSFKFL